MRTLFATLLVLSLAACGPTAPKKAAGPEADDVPQEVTCCITPGDDKLPDQREVVAAEKCAEDKRNPVDACNVGPGDNEPSM